MRRPRVVVVTRTKNRPILLQRCIGSVLGQTYTDWLHVIVNDGGDPVSLDAVVSRWSAAYRGRVRIIHNQESLGMQNASNVGIRTTDSEFVAIHDDDDSWAPTFLAVCVRHLHAVGPDAAEQGVVCQTNWVMEEIDSFGKIAELWTTDFYPFQQVGLSALARGNKFPPIAFLYRRAVHDTIGHFNQAFNELGDWDFNLRFLLRYDIGVLPNKLANYHWRHQGRGSSYGNTVTDGDESHRRMAVRVRDHYLREDLRTGRQGLGFLLLAAGEAEDQGAARHADRQATEDLKAMSASLLAKADHFERITADLTRVWKLKARLDLRGRTRAVRSWLGRLRRPAGPEPLRGRRVLREAMRRADVLSLDVFDTTLQRLVRKPTDVFLYIEDDVRTVLGRPELRFPDVRVMAEAAARAERSAAGLTDETTLDQIYAVLARMVGCDEATAFKLMEVELTAERQLGYGNPEILALIGDAVALGKQVRFASDMYLSSEQVLGLLRQHGVVGHELDLSSVVGKSKHQGALFDHVLTRVAGPPDRVLHVGDNLNSDVLQPRAHGLAAHHWTRDPEHTPLVDQLPSLSGAWDRDLASSLCAGHVRRQRLYKPLGTEPVALWEMLGYEVVGPLYLAYAAWVLECARRRGLRHVYFLSRDGFHPVEVFKRLRDRQGVAVEADYLFASRRLWNVAAITALDGATLDLLSTANPCMRVRHFLERIGLEPDRYREDTRRSGFDDPELVVTTKDGIFASPSHHRNVRELMRRLTHPILETARREREVLLDYLRDQGLFEDGVALADIGWHGSGVRSLNRLLTGAGGSGLCAGLYFGTWRQAQASIDAGDEVESFYFHLGRPDFRAQLIAESVELLETFFSAPHPTVVGLRKDVHGWQPEFGEVELRSEFVPGLALATDAAFAFVEHYLGTVGSRVVAPAYAYLDAVIERLWRCPTVEEARLLGGIGLRNTFGGQGPIRYLAKVPPPRSQRLAHTATLQEAYDHCFWKKGFLVQLTPADAELVRV